MNASELKKSILAGSQDELLLDIYVDEARIPYQKERYVKALDRFVELFGNSDVEVYSAPGRSEIGGNHTDHQHGEVLAASINNDAIAITRPLADAVVKVVSGDAPMLTIDLNDLELRESEKESTTALIKGVLFKLRENGHQVGGFETYITSDVLIGAGLSSSAAFETLIGNIISGLYNNMSIDAVEIAIVGQYAENVYFGKPCGLMDQMACSVGNLVHIDFADPANPIVEKVVFDMNEYGYSLCITDTKGSHADLTADYAAVPVEMKQVAELLGKEVLRGTTVEDILTNMDAIREKVGDRGVLRALHFITENERVVAEVAALKEKDIKCFLDNVQASGNSSYKFLQNIYSNSDVAHQNMSVALCMSEIALGDRGVCRVHGGGFAGTIQAFVQNDAVSEYQDTMNRIFGAGSCSVLKIRKYGGMKVL